MKIYKIICHNHNDVVDIVIVIIMIITILIFGIFIIIMVSYLINIAKAIQIVQKNRNFNRLLIPCIEVFADKIFARSEMFCIVFLKTVLIWMLYR